MEKKIDLSILVPIFNVEEYLEECLNSVYSLNINKEIILVNDGSTDSSLLIAEEFRNKYPNETILISQENKGLSEARNIALQHAKGEYIYFIDSDDFIISEKFEAFFSKIKGTDLNILRGLGNHIENGKKIPVQPKLEKVVPFEIMSGKEYVFKMFSIDDYTDYVWLNIYRRDFLIKNNFFFKKGITFEDVPFSLPVFWKANKIKQEADNFYCYRFREKSITKSPKKIMDHLYIYNYLLDFIIEQKISHKRITRFIIAKFKRLAKEEKIFNKEVYSKLWKLPKKNWNSIRYLLELSWRRYFCKQIFYDDIQKIIK